MHLFLTIDNRNANSGSRPQFPSRLGLTQIKWEHVSDSTMPAMPRYDWTHSLTLAAALALTAAQSASCCSRCEAARTLVPNEEQTKGSLSTRSSIRIKHHRSALGIYR